MIISHGRRYIFVHIPKTGGTSLALALEARAMAEDILIGDTPKAQRRKRRLKTLTPAGRLWKHATLADIEGVVPREDMQDFCIFTLVRNPWDRMVSYYHWLRGQTFAHPAVTLAKSLKFSDFLAAQPIEESIRKGSTRHYLSNGAGQEMPAYPIRLERFETDFAPVAAHLGFPIELPMANQSDRDRDYRGYYTDADVARVADMAREDIMRFGYEF